MQMSIRKIQMFQRQLKHTAAYQSYNIKEYLIKDYRASLYVYSMDSRTTQEI